MSVLRVDHRLPSICAAVALLSGCASHGGASGPGGLVPATQSVRAASGNEHVLYSFTGGTDGGNAASELTFDRTGDLYGTTVVGGGANCGTVFELAPGSGSTWKETVAYSFSCYGDGKNPHGGVTFQRGTFVGTTVAGGTGGYCTGDGCGVAFALTPARLNVLYSFTGGNDGFGPGGGLTPDSAGHLYGTAPDGGAFSEGVVYKLARNGTRWHQRVIHAFTGGSDGAIGSLGRLLYESPAFFGVTELGGKRGNGTVFRIQPSGGQWKLTTLYSFKGTPDAGSPYGGLVADSSGNLYGTTYYGGANGFGAIFKLVRNPNGSYRERVLHSFKGGADGSYSTSTLAFGNSTTLFGTTSSGGGSCDCGTIFKVDAKTGAEAVLHSFGGAGDGAYPYYGMMVDSSGNFYGTTVAGGTQNQGTVFEFTP
ncbi:MAG: choice-of-anchor tandem repeat GloVer-containing protein [Candidatus Tumulicola sp.]